MKISILGLNDDAAFFLKRSNILNKNKQLDFFAFDDRKIQNKFKKDFPNLSAPWNLNDVLESSEILLNFSTLKNLPSSISIIEENKLKAIKKNIKFISYRFGTISGFSPGMRFHTAVNKFCLNASLNNKIHVYKTALHQFRPYLSIRDSFEVFKFCINNNFFESNVLIQEISLEDYKYIDNAISDIVFVQSSHDYRYEIKFNIDLFDDQYKNRLDDLVIYEMIDDKVQILNTFYDLDYIYANGKTNSKYGVKVNDDFVVNEIPNKISIMDCYPNPFNPTLTVYYILDKKSFIDVSIYDLLGNKVINLEKGVKDIGEYYITWNGEDSYGNLMPSGIYFVKMNYDNNQLINKVTLLK